VEPRTGCPGLGVDVIALAGPFPYGLVLRFPKHYPPSCASISEAPRGGVMAARVPPLVAPYDPETAAVLRRMMPGEEEPIVLFRVYARNLGLAEALHHWGSYELSRRLSLGLRDRELVIDRVCALCGCEYEWGVHGALRLARRTVRDPDRLPDTRNERGSLLDVRTGPSPPRRHRRTPRRPRHRRHTLGPARRGVQPRTAPGPADAVRLVPRHQLHRPRHPAPAGSRRTTVPRLRAAWLAGSLSVLTKRLAPAVTPVDHRDQSRCVRWPFTHGRGPAASPICGPSRLREEAPVSGPTLRADLGVTGGRWR
jgi:alkylhydroperoxidase family enzyme